MFCFFSLPSSINKDTDDCYGTLKKVKQAEAFDLGVEQEVIVCLRHLRQETKRNKETCCYPFGNGSSCSSSFVPCPTRLTAIFKDISTSFRGTYICYKHLSDADLAEEITRHDAYTPPKKRKRMSKNSENCSVATQTIEVDLEIQVAFWRERAIDSVTQNQHLKELVQDKDTQIMQLKEDNKALKTTVDDITSKCDSTITDLMDKFHEAYLVHESRQSLFDPVKMHEFAEYHSPGLFRIMERFLTSKRTFQSQRAEKPIDKQKRRVVSILHQLLFFRNEHLNNMQSDCGLYLQGCGLSQQGLMAGQIMGFSAHPRSILSKRKGRASESIKKVCMKVQDATVNKQYLQVLVDDFHMIHTVQDPKKTETSTAMHFATELIDIYPSVDAIQLPANGSTSLHRPVEVKGQLCLGGADALVLQKLFAKILSKIFDKSLLQGLPQPFREFDITNADNCIEHLRCYTSPERKEMDKMKSVLLVDMQETKLRSRENYYKSFENMITECPAYKEYLKDHATLSHGDWPTWYFKKKIIATLNENENPLVQSEVPWQGPFHVSYNAQQNIVILNHAFFEQLYKAVFGRKKPLAKKPKPYRISTLITMAFGGWMVVRDVVLAKFENCKDTQYVYLLNLLDELVPLAFYFYPVIFRSGNFDLYMEFLQHFALMFICQRRRHYDKATLSQISDILFHQKDLPSLHALAKNHLNILSEKKVEIMHSLLRRQTEPWYTPEVVRQVARGQCLDSFDSEFCQHFVMPYLHHKGRKDYKKIIASSANFLADLFIGVKRDLMKTEKPQQPRKKIQSYNLPTLHTTVDTRNLPIGYSTQSPPDPMVVCDHDRCFVRANGEDETTTPWKVLGCGHSYHVTCIGNTKCKKCHNFLSRRILELAESFNEGLLAEDNKDADENDEDTSQDLLDDEIGQDDDDELPSATDTIPILNDFEGLELFRLELSRKFDSVM